MAEALEWEPAPAFVMSPDTGKSRENSIVAASVRRTLGELAPIVVTVRGQVRRERLEFLRWLVEEEYVPAFPRFLTYGLSLPLPRHQLIAEARDLLDVMGDWQYACTSWLDTEDTALEQIDAAPGYWELLL